VPLQSVPKENISQSQVLIFLPPQDHLRAGRKIKLTGFDVEVGTEIAKKIGLKATPVTNHGKRLSKCKKRKV
jgi:hypothetical protein